MASTNTNNKSAICFLIACLLLVHAVMPALATKLPPELASWFARELPQAKVRLDGTLEFSKNDLFLPLLPNVSPSGGKKVELRDKIPADGVPDLLIFSNGWAFVRVVQKEWVKTIPQLEHLPPEAALRLNNEHFPSDLIVPENFYIPKRLRALGKELMVPVLEDYEEKARLLATMASAKNTAIFVSSANAGKITMLEDSNLSKVSEFPTEGTPCYMATAGKRLYITDQAKCRVLILDPTKKQFAGQIDLPAKTSPKGIVAVPSGKLLYVSEYSANCVDVIELATSKVLLRTKVAAGPSQLALTPDGNSLLVLNVPAGRMTIIATDNQRVVGSVVVGSLPNGIAISPDSKFAYVTNRNSGNLSVVDLSAKKVIKTLQTGLGPTGVALDKATNRLFVANARDDTLSIFDLKTGEKTQDLRLPPDVDFPGAIMLTRDDKRLVVTSASTEAIAVLNLADLKFETNPVVGHPTDQVISVPY
jgi:YVTN family beta-propeller protein